MFPEVATFKVCLFRTADADCEYIVIIPGTLGILSNAVELAEDLWMSSVFDHVCIIAPNNNQVNRVVIQPKRGIGPY